MWAERCDGIAGEMLLRTARVATLERETCNALHCASDSASLLFSNLGTKCERCNEWESLRGAAAYLADKRRNSEAGRRNEAQSPVRDVTGLR